MSVRKFCGCTSSPDCAHDWFYDFRVNRRRYRSTTETANKQQAKAFEATEKTRMLQGKHGIRRQPDLTFAELAKIYIRDYAEQNKRSVGRDREIVKVLNRAFGGLLIHEITGHRVEQFKRDRLAGKWRGHRHTGVPKSIQPGTVNRECDTLRSIFSKAIEWKKLHEHPMAAVKRLKLKNVKTRILTEAEQLALLAACPAKLGRLVRLALITGARIGELLALTWADIGTSELVFLETKNGRSRTITLTTAIRAVLEKCPKGDPETHVFRNPRTKTRYSVNGVAHTFGRAVTRAGIRSGDVTLHTLRHTALSRMIARGIDQFTVMAISGHSSVRMLERYTHPTEARKVDALNTFTLPADGQGMGKQDDPTTDTSPAPASKSSNSLEDFGGRREARTRDLRVANAALSQLS